jgi:hypothetical protein
MEDERERWSNGGSGENRGRRNRGRWRNGGNGGNRDFPKHSTANGGGRRRNNGCMDGVADIGNGVTGMKRGMSDRSEIKGLCRWRWDNGTHIAERRRRSRRFVDFGSPCGIEGGWHGRSERGGEVIEPELEFLPCRLVRGVMLKHEDSVRIGRRRRERWWSKESMNGGHVERWIGQGRGEGNKGEGWEEAYLAVGEKPPPMMYESFVARIHGEGIDVPEALHQCKVRSGEGIHLVHDGRMCRLWK